MSLDMLGKQTARVFVHFVSPENGQGDRWTDRGAAGPAI
jgi:hypothetical protein